ncbi:hypothetical protein B9Z55_028355 [Caenorhabditis nigoni]|uniref:Uncharacterized protein n=1 Tax=Caenorhabditis nigoni TaxID=1611254 RepID=A0A2G5SCH6_9PELO|nr:hypothetical protein B9Z55_028355 [Caenorhabditis nigoni]
MKIEHNPKSSHKFRSNNKVNGKRRASSVVDYLTDASISSSSSPKFPSNTPSPAVIQAINSSPASQLLFNPFLFPFNNFLASGTMPSPTYSFQFPQITQFTTASCKKPFLVENLI